ncbi:MAG: DUF5808 domain-containing protein [Promicromonosporaceae bacterium]|nr:DUF5808 domain-containing protein [Promicromonosporaceae bacterium]
MAEVKLSLRNLVQIALAGVAVAAVVKELKKPEGERDWHGTVGPVPYDLRMPTVERVKERMWAPESEHIIGPRVFGAGWTVNFGRLYTLGKEQCEKFRAEHCSKATATDA